MFTLVLVSVCLCVAWMLRLKRVGPQPPMLPGAWPILGHAYVFIFSDRLTIWKLVRNLIYFSLNNGGVAKICIGYHTFYMITDPDDSHTVSNTCLRKPYLYKFAAEWIAEGLVTLDPPSWKYCRKLVNAALSQRILNSYMDVFNEQSRLLVIMCADKVKKGPFTHEPLLVRHALGTAYKTTVGVNKEAGEAIKDLYSDIVEKIFDTFIRRFMNIWLHLPFFYKRSSLKKECDVLVKNAVKITDSIIAKRKLELKESKNSEIDENNNEEGKFKPLLDILIEMSETDPVITDVYIREQMDTTIVATYDTTATTLQYTLSLIGTYPAVQEKIYKELQEVLGDSDKDLDSNDVLQLAYLEAVIKESLRVFTPVPVICREASHEVKLKNYTIPAGGTYIISPYGMHRHPMWGSDARQFRPERWLEPGGVPDDPRLFCGFSIGKRNCIGKVYAMMFIKTTLAHLLRRYHITADSSKLSVKCATFLKPISGHAIALELRTK